jgi:tetratricopeptide (TPR) repeat protein
MYHRKSYPDFILMVVVLLFTFVFLGCQGEQEKADSHLKEGKAYFSQGQYQKAQIEFLNATQKAPNNPDAWFYLGETMTRLGNAMEAFQAYSRAETLEPANPNILLKTASFLLLSDKADKIILAEEKIEKIVSHDPENIKALFLKAGILARKGELDRAKIVFEKIIILAPNHINAHEKLAAIKTFQKDFNGAEQHLVRAVNIDETDLTPRMILVSFYVSNKAFDKAEAQLLTAGRLNPDNVDIPIFLGNFYFRMKNHLAAEKAYISALKIAPNAVKPHVAAARFYDDIDRDDKALELYTKALTLEPDNYLLKNTLGEFYFKNGKIQAATSLVNEMLETRPGFFLALMLDSEIKIYQKSHKDALNRLQTLEKERPDSARLHHLKGLCYQGLGRNDKAIAALARSVNLEPDQFIPRALLARLYYDASEFDLARQHAQTILDKKPTNFQATDILANCDMEMGKQNEALKGFEKLIEIAPESPRGYQLMGLFYAYEKKYDQADIFLSKALDRSSFALDVIGPLIQNRIQQKDFKGAHDLISKQLKLPDVPPRFMATLHKFSGDLYLVEKNTKKALASFQRALDVDPDYQPTYYAIARIQTQTGNRDKAIEQYTRLLEKKPDLAVPHMMLGILMDARGLHDEAAQHYQKALDINPRHAPAANNLAYHLIQRTDKVEQALAWARLAREVLPEDPAIMDTLGLVYLKKGLVDYAIIEFKDSLERSANNPVVLLHLGQAYDAKGDFASASIPLKKVLTLDQNKDRINQATELLKKMNQ